MAREAGLPPAAVPAEQAPRAYVGWLVQLRWVAVVGQLLTVCVARLGYGVDVPLRPLISAIAVTAVSNFALAAWLRRSASRQSSTLGERADSLALGLLIFDLGVLTYLLFWSGGPTNPFCLFYFVNLVVCGILLPQRRAWLLFALSIACYVGLSLHYVPIEELRDPRNLRSIGENGGPTLEQLGLLVAFGLCAGVIVHFVTKLTGAMQLQQQQLREAELKRALARRWESLGTLAAGAAHELATPLSTIAVAASELEHQCRTGGAVGGCNSPEFGEIRHALERCRAILDRMSLDAGRVALEQRSTITIDELARDLAQTFRSEAARLQIDAQTSGEARLEGPREGLNQALRSFVQNALDASAADRPVRVALRTERDELVIEVADEGVGMSPEVLEHADEPFFTTKQAGEGMGLGRFIARQVVRHLGGRLETESTLGVGTRVEVRLPLNGRSQNHE